MDGAFAERLVAVLVTVASPLKVKLFKSGQDFDSVKSGMPSLSSSTSKISGTPSPSLSVHACIELLIA